MHRNHKQGREAEVEQDVSNVGTTKLERLGPYGLESFVS
jgi:hypothetical protein